MTQGGFPAEVAVLLTDELIQGRPRRAREQAAIQTVGARPRGRVQLQKYLQHFALPRG